MRHRFDFSNIMARASTWLALLSAASTASLGAYALLPQRAQDVFPEWLLISLGGMAVGAAFLIPVATSFKQRGLSKTSQVEIINKTTVQGDIAPEEATKLAEQAHGTPAQGQ